MVITAGRGYIDVAGASGDMVGVVTTDGRTVAAFVASCERGRGIGDPSLSTAEKGAAYVSAVAGLYADLIRDLVSCRRGR